jgi:CheY-like chemotaxis protein
MNKKNKSRNAEKTVLVVDDESDVLDIVAEMISDLGYRVQGVSSGEEALDLISRTPVDLVISDVDMRGMDGISLARWFKDRFPHLPMAMMTAYASEDVLSMLKHKVVDSLILKPFKMGELQGLVQNLTR